MAPVRAALGPWLLAVGLTHTPVVSQSPKRTPSQKGKQLIFRISTTQADICVTSTREVTKLVRSLCVLPGTQNECQDLLASLPCLFFPFRFSIQHTLLFTAWLSLVNGALANVHEQRLEKLLCFGTCPFLLCSELLDHYHVKKPKLARWRVGG